MKTEYREHPLGTPGLTERLKDEPSEPAPPRSIVGRMARLLARVRRRAGVR